MDGIPKSYDPVKDERSELARYKAALERIVKTQGRVCSFFTECSHVACMSSYAAWEIANHALRGWKLREDT
jgi:hypothetical protein